MKKIVIPICALALIFMVVPMAIADVNVTNGANVTTLTINTNLSYDVSPGVRMSVRTNSTDYCITSANDKTGTDKDNGMEYGTKATASGYAQQPKTTASGVGPTACTSATDIPSGSWEWIGGDGSSS